MQRSNSLPDLRVMVDGPINALPGVIMGPPMPRTLGFNQPSQSSSLMGALVPYKAPEVRPGSTVMTGPDGEHL
jgi:hypothetical protein